MTDSFHKERQAVIAEAKTWLSTPYLAQARVKGAGADCATSLIAFFADAGMIEDFKPEPYSVQWALHHRTERYIGHVLNHAVEITEAEVLPADIVMFKNGNAYGHGALIVEWPRAILHASELHGVSMAHSSEGRLGGMRKRFFRLKRWM